MINSPSLDRRGSSVFVVAVVIVILVIAGAGIWLVLERRAAQRTDRAGLTPEAEAYYKNLTFSDVDMKASESFAQQQLVEITGTVKNAGGKNVSLVEATAVFYDPYGNEVFRERVMIVRPRGGPLKAGESRPFRLPFDSLPQNWNQGLPRLAIAQIQFAK